MTEKTYSISELAQTFGITTRTIRFYEEKGLIHPSRDGQRRIYT
ncbi:MAG: MerR family DNA-binding transcriptional regulator, partial [Halioglobus sp.]